MQGVIFRQYIREAFFDLPLFARDLAYSITVDSGRSIDAESLIEMFRNAQVICWAIGEDWYPIENLYGCFNAYSCAMGMIGTKLTGQDFQDDAWIGSDWPTVEPVVAQLNAQMAEALFRENGRDDLWGESNDAEMKRVRRFIGEAVADIWEKPTQLASVHRIY